MKNLRVKKRAPKRKIDKFEQDDFEKWMIKFGEDWYRKSHEMNTYQASELCIAYASATADCIKKYRAFLRGKKAR